MHDSNVVREKVPHIVYECLKAHLCRNENARVVFRKGRGFQKPFIHLISCYKREPESNVEVRSKTNSKQSEIEAHFPITIRTNERERTIQAYMKLIVFRNEPLEIV